MDNTPNPFFPITVLPCPHCGRPVHLGPPEELRLCGYCGAKVTRPEGLPDGLPTTRAETGGGTA